MKRCLEGFDMASAAKKGSDISFAPFGDSDTEINMLSMSEAGSH